MTSTTTTFDLGTLRRGVENRDPEALIALYAEDAEVTVVDKSAPPSRPHKFHGLEEIAGHLRDVFGREMTHELQGEMVAGDRAAYSISCRYPSGERVLCMSTLELHDGLIARETGLQAWDE